MIDVLLLRHAPTDWNREGRIQGRTDVPLSAEGRALAARWRLPEMAKDWPCLSSPLRRTLGTARAMGLAPWPDDAFIEMDWGRLEGRRLADIRAERGAAFEAEEARGLDFRPEGGESPREAGARAQARLRALNRDSVVVTHKGILRALLSIATGWDMVGKAPARLETGAALRLGVMADGALRLMEAKVPLDPVLGRSNAPGEKS